MEEDFNNQMKSFDSKQIQVAVLIEPRPTDENMQNHLGKLKAQAQDDSFKAVLDCSEESNALKSCDMSQNLDSNHTKVHALNESGPKNDNLHHQVKKNNLKNDSFQANEEDVHALQSDQESQKAGNLLIASRCIVEHVGDLEKNKLSIKDLLQKAIELKKRFDYDGAVKILDHITKIDPYNSQAYLESGSIFYNKGELNQAIVLYRKVIALDSKNRQAYYQCGNALFKQKAYEEALKEYLKAVEIDPRDSRVCNMIGNTLSSLKRYNEAEENYKSAIKFNPKYSDAYYNFGVVLFYQNKYDESIRCFSKVIELNPGYKEAYLSWSYALKGLGKHKEAVEIHNRLLTLDFKLSEIEGFSEEKEISIIGLTLSSESVNQNNLERLVGFPEVSSIVSQGTRERFGADTITEISLQDIKHLSFNLDSYSNISEKEEEKNETTTKYSNQSKSDKTKLPDLQQQSQTVQWFWQSDPNPWQYSDFTKWNWRAYSTHHSDIIEDGFSRNQKIVSLVGYEIDLKRYLQTNITDRKKIRRVRREVKALQQSRFALELPKIYVMDKSQNTMNTAFGTVQHFQNYIIKKTPEAYKLYHRLKELFLDSKLIEYKDVVLEVIACIREGAECLEKMRVTRTNSYIQEANQIITEIEAKYKADPDLKLKEFLKMILRIYLMESFICYWINELLRSETWQEVKVLTPYLVCLTYAFQVQEFFIRHEEPQGFRETLIGLFKPKKLYLYRGTALEQEHLDMYLPGKARFFSWNGVTSTSRSKEQAERFIQHSIKWVKPGEKIGVLFIIEAAFASAADCEGMIDVSKESKFPDEQEVIIAPGTVFEVISLDINKVEDRYEIKLRLIKKFKKNQM